MTHGKSEVRTDSAGINASCPEYPSLPLRLVQSHGQQGGGNQKHSSLYLIH